MFNHATCDYTVFSEEKKKTLTFNCGSGFWAAERPLEETLDISLLSPPEGGVSLKSVVQHICILSDSLFYRMNYNLTGRICDGRRYFRCNKLTEQVHLPDNFFSRQKA